MKKLRFLLALWLAITATGVWAEENPETVADSIPEQVQMSDGRTVKAMQVPRRASDEDYTYTYKGVKYTYISENNWNRYFDTNMHKPTSYGWWVTEDGWYVDPNGNYLVAASIDEESVPENGEVYILNDLVGYFTSHTHLGCVADQGFTGESKVKRVYFQDADAQAFNASSLFQFFIGHKAFANAPNLEKIDLMQYTTRGTNHWEPMPVTAVKLAWGTMLDGSPNAMIRVATSTLDDYRNSSVWAKHIDRIISYEPSGYEIKEYGASYKCMLADDGKTYLTNDGAQIETMKQRLRPLNADYQNFNAMQLMASADNGATVYYTTVEGADADYLKNNNGVARIYNDVGSYYNYKNIAIRRGAFLKCTDLKAVEFWQTNGRSKNSYSDMKIIIENGAFRGCKNLKEIRMYYRVQDGDDHWEALGPKDVIPGDNIFGLATSEEIESAYDNHRQLDFDDPDDVRIVVSPSRYTDFITDPNWAVYAGQIVASEYEPANWDAQTVDGLIYDYASKSLNSLPTDEVVTQELSWWNVPIIAIETITAIKLAKSLKEVSTTIKEGYNLWRYSGESLKQGSLTASDATEYIVGYKTLTNQGLSGMKELVNKMSTDLKAGIEECLKTKVNDVFRRGLHFGTGHTTLLEKTGCILGSNGNNYFAANLYEILVNNASLKDAFIRMAKESIKLWHKDSAISLWKPYEAILRRYYMDCMVNVANAVAESASENFLGYVNGAFSGFMGLGANVATEQFQRGLVDNIRANIHQVSSVGTLYFTPDKKLVYHVYIDKPAENKESYTIYNDIGRVYNYRTVAIRKNAFQGNQTVKEINFAENCYPLADAYVPMQLAIADSAFAGCTNLQRFNLIYKSRLGGERGLGPENFILCGDSIFAGCDSTKLQIVIDKNRLQDFLDSDTWSKYKRFFVTREVQEEVDYTDFGVNYAYAYDNNTVQKVTKVSGHKIEHLMAVGADNEWLANHQGQLGLFNDIGIFNNYKLDLLKEEAFRGNKNIENVQFWDLKGWLWGGDTYYDLGITLQDSCFADNPNLKSVDMLYLCTDGINEAKELTPSQMVLGNGVFDNCDALKIKMTPQQLRWFEADTAWVKYKDKFAPCLIKPVDKGVKAALSGLTYTTKVGSPEKWDDVIDLTLLNEKGFDWLKDKFMKNEKIKQFPEFKQFEWTGLDYVGGSWFVNCRNLTDIVLPSTVKRIGGYAFQNCDLREIEIPAAVENIEEYAFSNNEHMKTVRCLGSTPATLGKDAFGYTSIELVNDVPVSKIKLPEDFKIYVPAEAVDAYKEKWTDYKDYIVAATDAQTFPKSVTTTEVGQLAEKLGLETIMDGNYLMGLKGAYWNIDSLTVSGPLNGVDVGVLRFLAGADVNNSDPTYGRMRYLNMYGARLKQDKVHPYQCNNFNDFIDKDDVVDEYMFYYCDKLETVILPKEATYIGEHAFDHATNLKQLAIGDKTVGYDDCITKNVKGLDELVFLTEQKALSDALGGFDASGRLWFWAYDSWETNIGNVFCRLGLAEKYGNEPTLIKWMHGIAEPFADNRAWDAFANKGYFFPSEFVRMSNIDGILVGSGVTTFDELRNFTAIGDLGAALAGCDKLRRITLPDTLRTMGYSAFQGCSSLDSIYVYADSVPAIESGTFRDLPASFKIYVPKTLAKRYREAWSEYADHIVGNDAKTAGDGILVVTTTEKNTLAKQLGLRIKCYGIEPITGNKTINELEGNYTHIRGLKVVGPISGQDFSVLRYLAGYSPWTDSPNYLGHLEYLDLYDATIEPSEWYAAFDKNAVTNHSSIVKEANELPYYAFLKAYSLKTLILPKTLKTIHSRSMLECEYLETVVIGDSTTYINWDAFDDCAAMTRMYILAEKKPEMTQDNWLWRNLCNNYNPTFDAFYVRPSLYEEYVADKAYTGSWFQRTSNISKGAFNDDESFAAFAAHAAATEDDLTGVTNIDGWFAGRTGIKNLTPLRYTQIDTLKAAEIQPLTQLEKIALPLSLVAIEDDAFSRAKNLRYADFLMCEDDAFAENMKNGGLQKLGITEDALCYMPKKFGESTETNVVYGDTTSVLNCANYKLIDGRDYDVPYKFNAAKVENTRTLAKSAVPYTICLPYSMQIPANAKAYKMSGRSDNELIFTQTTETLEALQPYLIWADQSDASLNAGTAEIPASGGMTFGKQHDAPGFSMRGTLNGISNDEASELGAYTLQQDGKWHPVLSDNDEHRAARILPYRAYLLQNRGAGTRSIGMSLEGTTGIEQLRTIDSDGTERVYDLNGRQISAPAKGINIINGKKVINR